MFSSSVTAVNTVVASTGSAPYVASGSLPVTQTGVISGFRCPLNDAFPYGDHSRHAYPGNCVYFIMCLRDGSVKIGSCEPGSAYNRDRGICETADKVAGCQN